MASVVVDGLVLPISLGGHPALDFCNTRAAWGADTPKEYLRSHTHLSVWARENGLLSPSTVDSMRRAARRRPAEAAAVVARAVRFRDALYAVLLHSTGWSAVNDEVRRAGASALLTPGTPAVWGPSTGDLDAPLLAVAWSAAGLLISPLAAQVGACPGDGCGWLFADPRARRRWCSMALCGNRAKARRHAARRSRPTTGS